MHYVLYRCPEGNTPVIPLFSKFSMIDSPWFQSNLLPAEAVRVPPLWIVPASEWYC